MSPAGKTGANTKPPKVHPRRDRIVRNLLALIGLLVVAFIGLGWYCGWYTFVISPGTDGRVKFQGDLDTRKIVDDAKKAGETVGNVVQNAPARSDGKADFVGPPMPESMKSESSARPTAPSEGPVKFTFPGSLPGPTRK
jgi:hypothetical protein